MGNRVEWLRMGLLGGACLLVCVIGGFLWYGHRLAHGWLAGLPGKLGVNVKSESGEVSYSHSVLGKTVYTIHAAKQVEYKDGTIALHDVDMVLYGTKGDRADRVYGKEFEYDQKTGVVRAIGEVHIDLQAPAAGDDQAAPGGHPAVGHSDAAGPQVIHAITSNLVYLEKLGVAATSEPIEFHLAQMTGHAIGADYNSDSNVLVLHAAVHVTGIAGGRPVNVTATRAVLDQRNQRTDLTDAKYDSLGEGAQADVATVYTRSDGSAERIAAQGHVTGEKDGATMTAASADMLLNAKSQPQSARLTGGIAYQSDEPLRQARGRANESTIAFDAQGQPSHAVFVGGVDLLERIRASEDAGEPWNTRELTAAKVEASLTSAPPSITPPTPGLASSTPRKSELRDVDATGGAHLTLVGNGSLSKPPRANDGTTELAGDELKTHLVSGAPPQAAGNGVAAAARPGPQLDTLAGFGHTLFRQATVGGMEQTSAGDTLEAKFRPMAKPKQPAAGPNGAKRQPQTADQLVQTAVQQGHVSMTRKAPAKGAMPGAATFDEEHATAERSTYEGDLDRLTLTGGVQMTDASTMERAGVLWANLVALDHATGDAHAEGAVKVNYQQVAGAHGGAGTAASGPGEKQGEPAHILADHADLKRDENTATFYGVAGKPARLWQGGSQVEAAVLELSRDNLGDQRLFAHGPSEAAASPWNADGDGTVASAPVHTVLATAGSSGAAPRAGKPAAKASSSAKPPEPCSATAATPTGGTGPRPPQAMRIASRELVYSDLLRQADFSGGVRVDGNCGMMRSRQATAYLQIPDVETWGLEIPDETHAGAAGKVPAAQGPSDRAAVGVAAAVGGLTSFSGSVERVVATGRIELLQPGRRATGERLVYTASDGWSVLTGNPTTLPRLVDAAQGTITGVSLRFRSDDDSVLISNALPGAEKAMPGERVHSEARVHQNGEKKPEGQKR